MEPGQENTSGKRKGRGLVPVFILAILLCWGLVYLSTQQTGWQDEPPAPQQPPAKVTPSASAAKPAAPPLRAPGFDAVSADEFGTLVVAGKAEPDAAILLRNKTQKLGEAKADENGDWVLMLEHLPAGEYELSLLAIDPKSQQSVPGRRTFALKIAPPRKIGPVAAAGKPSKPAPATEAVTASMQPEAEKPRMPDQATQPEPEGRAVATVKQGDSLWSLAQQHYGQGARYRDIVKANKPQIRNPNLIYPDQQFAIPRR